MLRKLNFIILLIAVSAIVVSAKIVDSKPVFTIGCPPDSIKASEKIRLTATTKTQIGDSVTYNWTVSAGAEFKPDGTEKSPTEKPLHVVNASAGACELNALYLDSLRTELANNPNNSVRINFSPGKTETAVVNLKRQKIFTDKIRNRFPDVETQIGEKTDGSGEVRIYLKNFDGTETFYLLIYAIKNKSICLDCCDAEDMPKNLVSTVKKKTLKKKTK